MTDPSDHSSSHGESIYHSFISLPCINDGGAVSRETGLRWQSRQVLPFHVKPCLSVVSILHGEPIVTRRDVRHDDRASRSRYSVGTFCAQV